jgi:hypothetical protein
MKEITENELSRGEFMEEQLRAYFLDLGYYVVRGAKLKFHEVEVTDIDLWIYHRSTPISRERINVDIKNKAKPAAVERIIVCKGLMNILGFDRCIVATTDKRNEIIEFGEKHGVIILNGNFLNRIKRLKTERYSEEEFVGLLNDEFAKFTTNWFLKNEQAKTKIIQNLDNLTANHLLDEIKILLTQIHSNPLKKNSLIRLLYLFISYLCISVDFILKDYSFLEVSDKLKRLDEGFRYGVVGETKIKLRLEKLALSTNRSTSSIRKMISQIPIEVLVEFFGKVDSSKNLFRWATEYENLAYSKSETLPSMLPIELKGIIGMLCDFSQVDRKLILSS